MNYYYRVLIEYKGRIYAWKGSATSNAQARAKALTQLRMCFNEAYNPMRPTTDLHVHLCEICSDLEPDQSYQDIRSMCREHDTMPVAQAYKVYKEYLITFEEELHQQNRDPSCLIHLYNRCVMGQQSW